MLAGRRMLILLDNASDEAQVRSLLASRRGCLTLITCRNALIGLEALRWLWLSPLPEHDTVELVARILGDERPGEPQAVRELADLCGNLPLWSDFDGLDARVVRFDMSAQVIMTRCLRLGPIPLPAAAGLCGYG